MTSEKKYWFRAKTYGWGWGLPLTWQGWCVLILYLGGILAASIFLSPAIYPSRFGAIVALLTVAMVVVCWKTGEPPGWRWGNK